MTNGTLYFKDNFWWMNDVPPHICIKLKAIFTQIPKGKANPFRFSDTIETCNDLAWFIGRYAMSISQDDAKRLYRQKKKYDNFQDEVGRLLLPDYLPTVQHFRDGKKERDYQAVARELALKTKRMVCGDDIGLGKTIIPFGMFIAKPQTLPALVVVQTHLPPQWVNKIEEFTYLKVHRIDVTRPYSLPKADIYIIKYSCLAGWSNFFESGFFKSVSFDEIQELRNEKSAKYDAANVAADCAEYVIGLTATLIYNYGNEAFNIFNTIKKGCLGTRDEFTREWCGGNYGRVIKDPAAFGSYLRQSGLFLRRTRQDVKREMPAVNKILHEVEVDNHAVHQIEQLAIQLSMTVMTGSFTDRGQASRELDMVVRMNTGVSKAREVANYVRILLENNEPVILVGWHRNVYDIWLKELADYNPVMFTGSESGTQKEKNKQMFLNGETNLLIMSLRSGPGTDGLQKRCCTMVIGELDWSPGVHNQIIGRIDRDGQESQVTVIFVVCNQGSDPVMIDVLGLKSSQAAYIQDPELGVSVQYSDDSRIKQLAKNYLDKHHINYTEPGEAPPTHKPEESI